MASRKKPKLTITVDQEAIDWIQARVGLGKRFASISHGFETGVAELMKAENRGLAGGHEPPRDMPPDRGRPASKRLV